MMINDSKNTDRKKKSVFQPQIKIDTEKNKEIVFCDYSIIKNELNFNDEEKSNNLLYRNRKNYATGLGTATQWKIDEFGKGYINNDYFPEIEVPQLDFDINDEKLDKSVFSMKYLSDLNDSSDDQIYKSLEGFMDSYERWIDELEEIKKNIPNIYSETAKTHIDNCRFCLERMKNGIRLLINNPDASIAFRLANRAMFMQRTQISMQARFDNIYPDNDEINDILMSSDYYKHSDIHFWRPFQLAFILMSINSIVDDSVENKERNTVDLIWFPTGGGKTEAYLGLTAFTIFYRRLKYRDNSGGTAVIMRYTLRLLAAQQFTRAATLICACEYIRRDSSSRRNRYRKYDLGDLEINIGLWIGGDHTPNKLSDAKKYLNELEKSTIKNIKFNKESYNKFQLLKCPWCGTKLVKDLSTDNKLVGEWGYRIGKNKSFSFECPQECCDFNNKLPIQVIDEEIYKNPPSLLFATVDKFALMPWYPEISNFFACNNDNRTPELIIQDELHLISGPLGSMVGLYETAVDYLCSSKGVTPKIIASTATICRAK